MTANTRCDGEDLLRIAGRIGVQVHTTVYLLERADEALADLAHDRLTCVAVLRVGPP